MSPLQHRQGPIHEAIDHRFYSRTCANVVTSPGKDSGTRACAHAV